MQEYPVDIDAEQVLRWLKQELAARPHEFEVTVERDYVSAEDLDSEGAGIGEDSDVASVSAVGLVEVRPVDDTEGWILRIRAEDPLGDHLPEDHSVDEAAEEIDLETFEQQFLPPGRGVTVETVLLATSAAAAARISPMFLEILTDRHAR